MSTILGIDYGSAKIGLAIAPSGGKMAVPLKVLRPASLQEALTQIGEICIEEDVEEVVVGIPKSMLSQEELAKDPRANDKSLQQQGVVSDFMLKLQEKTLLPTHAQDERLTTHEANKLLAGHPKELEDAVAAMLILQSYLDSHADSIPS